ncbi:MAG: carboxylate--amine ligase [Candidatus Dormibacteraeota bacterium]|nr:carboxylate--amine ligase [Candidatus Dormibacteraeota bacterium]
MSTIQKVARIYLGGAGSASTNNVIRSLRATSSGDRLIGASSNAADLLLADVDDRYLVPRADDDRHRCHLLRLLADVEADVIHVQNDLEVRAISAMRTEIEALGVRTLLPSSSAIDVFMDKYASYQAWAAAALPVPETLLIERDVDLVDAFQRFGRVWLRATTGFGGYGALPTDDLQMARCWIERFHGWGTFTAAEQLTAESVTWQSLWYGGRLVAAQTRRRLGWAFGSRTLSGVTGVTGIAETWSSPEVTALGRSAVIAVEQRPHGIYGVDMTADASGRLRLTEVNVGRFFTTIHFFTRAGFNFPSLFVDLALGRVEPPDHETLDPLPDGKLWIRGMDTEPLLTDRAVLETLMASSH